MILIFKRKKLYFTIFCLLLIVGVFFVYTNSAVAMVLNNNTTKKVPVYRVDTTSRKVALTFDAAWGSDKTQNILDTLSRHNVKATFFLVDFWIEDNVDLVKKMDEEGIEIGNHSVTHLDMTKLSEKDRENEIKTVNEKIKNITNKELKFFRFPFGAYDKPSILSVEKYGLIPVQWDVDSLDWKGIDGQQILNRIKQNVQPGSIILFHNNSDHILDCLDNVISYLKSQDYEMVTLSNLIYMENYYIDANGVQHQNIV